MRLSSVYLYEKIKEKYEILKKGNLSGNDGYLRPFLRCGINRDDRKKEDRFRSGHVYVIQVSDDEEWERVVPVMKDIFWIFCKKSDSEKQNDNMLVGAGTGIGTGTEVEAGAPESFETDINRNEVEVAVSSCDDSDFGNIPYIQVALENLEEIAEFMNDMQEIFDTADGWERKIHDLMLEHAGMERLLQVTSEFLQNPLTVIGLDFTFAAEAGSKYLPPRARLYTDEGLNVEYVNALLQNETYREMADTHETVMFPAYISGCRSMNRNLFVDEKATHRLILTECRVEITQGVICVLDILSEKLEFLLAHEEEETDPDRDIEQIFVRVLSDRTADYMQISRELSELGWGGNHEYMCLILQITYLNQQNLSTKAISRYIKKKLGDSVSFLYQDEIVVFFDLTRLGMNQEEVAGNELAHTILRGAVNKHGEAIPNYHYEDLRLLWEKYQEKNLKNPAVIVDTNHSNSNKQYDQQVRIAKEVLHSRQVNPELHTLVKGLMIESYIEPGNQKIGCDHIYGKSITDPCLGWEESERLLYTIAEMC